MRLAPAIGSILNPVFGINRIQRSAVVLGLREVWERDAPDAPERPLGPTQDTATGLEPGLRGLNRAERARHRQRCRPTFEVNVSLLQPATGLD